MIQSLFGHFGFFFKQYFKKSPHSAMVSSRATASESGHGALKREVHNQSGHGMMT